MELQFNYDWVNVNRTEDSNPGSQPRVVGQFPRRVVGQFETDPVPNPVRGCMFIDTGSQAYIRPSWSNPPGSSLSNAAGCVFWPWRVYKHATPDGVGNVSRESST